MLPLLLTASLLAASPGTPIAWHTWSPTVFDQARAEHKQVLLDLGAVWCHWCHVMDEETYKDARVRALLAKHFIAVRVDQDADPALSQRYDRWGWPATIVFAADGTEIVKRKGFIPPRPMESLLAAIVADPSPGPSVVEEPELPATAGAHIAPAARKELLDKVDSGYDAEHGGWGNGHRMLDAELIELALSRAETGEPTQRERAEKTLSGARKLIDPVAGGIYQYAERADWSSPHFEKLASLQAQSIRAYALGFAANHKPEWRAAAEDLHRYVRSTLTSPEGAFYVSQDADVSPALTGHTYYAWNEAERKAHPSPAVDRHLYARENGWLISALCTLSDATGNAEALAEAQRAATWVLANRALPGGGFRHGEASEPPALGDTLAMAQAFWALYESTADRAWLTHAQGALDFIGQHFADASGQGFITAPASTGGRGVFAKAVRQPSENAELARLAARMSHAAGKDTDRKMAERAMHLLAAVSAAQSYALPPLALLADGELAREPLHVTLVGSKDDEAAKALYLRARAEGASFRLIEWADPKEPPLPHPTPPFPPLRGAAAFVCQQRSCSLPLKNVEQLGRALAQK